MKCQKPKLFEHLRNKKFRTKAQGLPLNTIIIAALGLLVLVILIWMVGGKFRQFGTGVHNETQVQDCKAAGGTKVSIYECDRPMLGEFCWREQSTAKCEPLGRNYVCCIGQAQQAAPAAPTCQGACLSAQECQQLGQISGQKLNCPQGKVCCT